MAIDGNRYRLDDRGNAMGREPARPIAASLGLILLGLLRTPLRWSGAVLLALAIIWAAAPQPDILGDGRNIAVRGKDGLLLFS